MRTFDVVLKNLREADQQIVLCSEANRANAETMRKNWRRILGNKHWWVDRRPGLDTLDHLALTVQERKPAKE